jgi:autotransporter-associated beta strand protein
LTTIAGGTLALGSAFALGAGSLTFGGGTLQFGLASQIYGNRITNSGANAIAIDSNGLAGELSGAIDASNTGGLIKSGSGILRLNGINTYTGTTAITGGGILVNSGSAFAGGGTITLATGTSLDYAASADTPLYIGGDLVIAGGNGSSLGTSIGSSSMSAAIIVLTRNADSAPPPMRTQKGISYQ